MRTIAQKHALQRYRHRLCRYGMIRFEIVCRDEDRDLIRSLARRLAFNDATAADARAVLAQILSDRLSGPNDSGSSSPRVTVRRGPSGPQM